MEGITSTPVDTITRYRLTMQMNFDERDKFENPS